VKHITFYLDFISPYAYLAFEALPEALQGLSYSVSYKPVFLGGLLKHTGILGPAEVPSKRNWVYRQTQWLAQQQGVPLDLPAVHPFNPLGLLRLAVATDPAGLPNRYVCETLFRHVWVGGADAADTQRLATITQTLAPAQDPAGEAVKSQLKAHGEQAITADVFGVPAFEVDGKVFWGLDGLPMLRAYMVGDAWFATSPWADAALLPNGLAPRKAP
jgi:2-hydroxychromene-2-carboxylate isomerase